MLNFTLKAQLVVKKIICHVNGDAS